MTAQVQTKSELDAAGARKRLAELQRDETLMKEVRDHLRNQLLNGVDADEMEALAARLIAGEPAAATNLDPRLADLNEKLRINAKAQSVLLSLISLDELRRGFQKAAPLHARAVAHVKRLDKALSAVEAALLDAKADHDAFNAVHDSLGGLQLSHPQERAPYDEYDLVSLVTWRGQFVGDGLNPTRLDLWREGARDRGLL